MKSTKRMSTRIAALLAVFCLTTACLGLAACGGGSSSSAASASSAASSAASSSTAASSSASASASSAATTADKFAGTWKIAGAEYQGLTMGGNFADLAGVQEDTSLVIKTDGTGSMTMEGETIELVWTEAGSDAITIKSPDESKAALAEGVPITYKDGALFMEMEMEGDKGTIIYTQDGNYAGAKQISMDATKPISSDSELLGTWKLVGMNMGGVSLYGNADALAAMTGGNDTSITFEAGGVAKIGDTESGTWAIDSNGATLTTEGTSGTVACPIAMLDGELAVDYSAAFGGVDFIMLFAK